MHGFPGDSVVKSPLANAGNAGGWGDPLEEDMATHSSVLAWRIPGTEEPGGLQSVGLQKLDMTEQLNNNVLYIPQRKRLGECTAKDPGW